MPEKARRKRPASLKQKLQAIVIRIPINVQTLTAALLLTQQIIELARVIKIPLQVEKVAPMEIVTVTPPAQIDPVATETKPTEPVKEGTK